MLKAILGDVVLTGIAYVALAGLSRNPDLLVMKWDWRKWLCLEGMGLALSVGIETYALNSGRWTYTELTPVIAGISLIPVLQLLLLFPLTFWLGRRLLV